MHDGIWIVKKGFKGDLTDVVYDKDTGKPKDLTGLTVKLLFKHPDTLVVVAITATILDQTVQANLGKIKVNTINAGNSYFNTEGLDYVTNLEISSGSTVLEPSDEFIIRVVGTN